MTHLPTFAEYRSQPDFGCWVDHDRDEWIIAPVTHHRDSDLLTESNWKAQLDAIGGEGNSREILRFNHFAVGWIEILIVNPRSRYAAIAEDLAERLESYPILNEEEFSAREYDCYLESWNDYGADEFISKLESDFELEPATVDFLDDCDNEDLRQLFESVNKSGGHYHAESSGVSINIDTGDLTREDLAQWLLSERDKRYGTGQLSATAQQQLYFAIKG